MPFNVGPSTGMMGNYHPKRMTMDFHPPPPDMQNQFSPSMPNIVQQPRMPMGMNPNVQPMQQPMQNPQSNMSGMMNPGIFEMYKKLLQGQQSGITGY